LRPLALVGPTASGKSAAALEVARRLPGPPVEIVVVDSMQVYRGMDIGTAKPSAAEQAEIPHHLIDLADPVDQCSLSDWLAAARAALEAIEKRGHRALVVGGTGLYVQALVDGLEPPGQWPDVRAELESDGDTAGLHDRLVELDPVAAGRMEPGNRRRIVRALEVTLGSGRPFSSFGPGLDAFPPTPFRLAAIWLPRTVVAGRIAERVDAMVTAGLIDEVRRLDASGLSPTARQGLGYKEVLDHLHHGAPLDAAVEEIVRRTRAFARRQRVWFRRDPRIHWYGAERNPVAVVPALLGDWSRCN
jgi:tRNA dimethylallyltransferase